MVEWALDLVVVVNEFALLLYDLKGKDSHKQRLNYEVVVGLSQIRCYIAIYVCFT